MSVIKRGATSTYAMKGGGGQNIFGNGLGGVKGWLTPTFFRKYHNKSAFLTV